VWYRVFGISAVEPAPADLTAHLLAAGLRVEPHFKGDDLGWTSGELRLPGREALIALDRYLAKEDELRDDLNAYAAELETMNHSPNNIALMAHVIQTQQLLTLRKPQAATDEVTLEKILVATCQYLASQTAGVYQIDGQGWFAADGSLLIQED